MLSHQQSIVTREEFQKGLDNKLDVHDIEYAQQTLLSLTHYEIRAIRPNDRNLSSSNTMVMPGDISENNKILPLLIDNGGEYVDKGTTFCYRVLVSEGNILGEMVYSLKDKELMIHALKVTSDYRSQKIGTLLVNDALIKAKALNIANITLKTDFNHDTFLDDKLSEFYHGLGFKPININQDQWWVNNADLRKEIIKSQDRVILDRYDITAMEIYTKKLQFACIYFYMKQATLGHLHDFRKKINVDCAEEVKAKVLMHSGVFKNYVEKYYGNFLKTHSTIFNAAYDSLMQQIDSQALEKASNINLHNEIINALNRCISELMPNFYETSEFQTVEELFNLFNGVYHIPNKELPHLGTLDVNVSSLEINPADEMVKGISKLLEQKAALESDIQILKDKEQEKSYNISHLEQNSNDLQKRVLDLLQEISQYQKNTIILERREKEKVNNIINLQQREAKILSEISHLEKDIKEKLLQLSEVKKSMDKMLALKSNLDTENEKFRREKEKFEIEKKEFAIKKQEFMDEKAEFNQQKGKFANPFMLKENEQLKSINQELRNNYKSLRAQIVVQQSIFQFNNQNQNPPRNHVAPQSLTTYQQTQALKRSNEGDVSNGDGAKRHLTEAMVSGNVMMFPLSNLSTTNSRERSEEREKLIDKRIQLVTRFYLNNDLTSKQTYMQTNGNLTITPLSPEETDLIDMYLLMSKYISAPVRLINDKQLNVEPVGTLILSDYFRKYPKEKELFSIYNIDGDKINLISFDDYQLCYQRILMPLINVAFRINNNKITPQL